MHKNCFYKKAKKVNRASRLMGSQSVLECFCTILVHLSFFLKEQTEKVSAYQDHNRSFNKAPKLKEEKPTTVYFESVQLIRRTESYRHCLDYRQINRSIYPDRSV